ncbi:hypothetical protein [Mycolicibacterium aichiense]|uniref:Uncharacterized protein n=1 Tax=Mycolicibacterium aichiense TaxID=1799 RepID=A0AAD1MEW0_9MYCO|nr:hypothetical protein [Mycolicibacterium aichiense]MCV7017235.1 hypothetical protein [Mycolicibacterium aichiense]BBX10336.1 hypothetical protein MAIC_51390 [Mycolicibacterium aichiense]STZ26005.1 Uncharacterised protein [Mycolicibacterium aichiense]
MAKHDPAGDVDEASPVPFGDPFGPYPEQPYPGSAPVADARADDDTDPPTDPALPMVTADDGFDPFAPDAFWFPERPWYRKKQATLALTAIGVAGVAILVAAVLLVALDSDGSEQSPATPSTSSSTPTTTALTSSQPPEPPPPPPPPPESPPPAPPQGTWYPRYPQQNDGGRPNVTTPQTRPPQISVRPTHRPAFPNQPGSG